MGMALSWIIGNEPKTKDPYGAPGSGKSTGISVVTIVVILAAWWLITELELIRPLFLPGPELVFSKFLKISCYDHYMESFLVFIGARTEVPAECKGFSENALHQHILWSLYRVFSSFLLAVVTAIPIGIAMGMSRIARGVFDPPIEFYRPIPPLAYLPLTIIWFGIGDFAKIFLIYLACFAPLAISARAGVRSCSIEQIHAAYSMGASKNQVIWHVVAKAALPVALFVIIPLIGGCTGSTSCSAKVFRYQVLYAALVVQIRRIHSPHGVFPLRYQGRPVEPLAAIHREGSRPRPSFPPAPPILF